MRKLYREYFYIPRHEKICDKVMVTRVATAVGIVVMCLMAMSFTAYAYFSHPITSSSNIIKAANFDADVFINITTETGEPIPVSEESNHAKTAQLKAGNIYHIVLDESTSNTAGTGFVIVSSLACKEVYHTQQLGNDESVEGGRTEKIIFDLSVTVDTTVCFVSHWGTSSHYDDFKDKGDGSKRYITNANIGDKAVKMVINGVDNSVSDSEDEGKEITTPETTTTTETATRETTGTSEPTTTTEPSNSTTEPATQTTEPAATETTSTEATAETQPATESSETTDAPTTEVSE